MDSRSLTFGTQIEFFHEAIPFLRPSLAVMGSDGFIANGISHNRNKGRTKLLPEEGIHKMSLKNYKKRSIYIFKENTR